MNRILVSLFSLLLLSACSSSSFFNDTFQGALSGNISESRKPLHLSGGNFDQNSKSFYWYTRTLSRPIDASDYVRFNNGSWYKTSYSWKSGVLRELVREGEKQASNSELKPYLIHIRFSAEGEAIYQRYRLDNKVLPLDQEDLSLYVNQSKVLMKTVDQQYQDKQQLVQGIWDGSVFETCQGKRFSHLTLSQGQLPAAVYERVKKLNSYVAFIGRVDSSKDSVFIDQLLSLEKASHGCIQRTQLSL